MKFSQTGLFPLWVIFASPPFSSNPKVQPWGIHQKCSIIISASSSDKNDLGASRAPLNVPKVGAKVEGMDRMDF
jgi:hypothetical protein